MALSLRPLTDEDTGPVLALNERFVDLLAPMDEARLRQLSAWADRSDVVELDGRFVGFVLTVGPGTGYDSQNYRWFSHRYPDFLYLDRIVLDPSVRRSGIGTAVYAQLEQAARPRGRVVLEVNADPPNVPSLRFHHGRGFVEVGRRGPPGHVVSLMEKVLAPGS